MNNWQKEIIDQLSNLKDVPRRDPGKASKSRNLFLTQATIKKNNVTQQQDSRHMGWSSIFMRKGLNPMKFAAILVVITMLLGGVGTVAAAQSSLPGDALYDLKLTTEDIRFDLTTNEDARLELALIFAQERFEEIHALLEEGVVPPDETFEKFQMQYQMAMQYALEKEEPENALEQIRTRLELQTHTMITLQNNMPEDVEANTNRMILQLDETVRNQIRMVEEGLEAPLQLKAKLQEMMQKPDWANEDMDKSMQNQAPQGNGNNGGDNGQNGSGQNGGGSSQGGGGK